MTEQGEANSIIEHEAEQPKFQYDIIFLRHGDRQGLEDALTEKGKQQAREYGSQAKFQKIAVRSSPTHRTQETAGEIYSTAPNEIKFSPRLRKSLNFETYFSPEYLSKIRAMIRDGKREEAGLYQLDFETQRPEPRTASARETAAAVAKLLKHYLDMSKHFKPDTKLGLINISHDFVLAPFIAEVLRRTRHQIGQQVSMKQALIDAGGTLKPLEEIKFSLSGDEREKQLKLFFRGQEYLIDPALIDDISGYEFSET